MPRASSISTASRSGSGPASRRRAANKKSARRRTDAAPAHGHTGPPPKPAPAQPPAAHQMWGGRFSLGPSEALDALNRSLPVDHRQAAVQGVERFTGAEAEAATPHLVRRGRLGGRRLGGGAGVSMGWRGISPPPRRLLVGGAP